MIQVGRLRSFVPKGETEEKFYFKAIKGFNYPTLKECFDNCEHDLPKHLGEKEQYNLFYTVAHHLEGQRTKSSWKAQDIIPFDLDGIDLEQIDLYAPLVAKVCGFDLEKCAVVYSGNGVHVLVNVSLITDPSFIKDRKTGYVDLLDKVVAQCEKQNLPIEKDSTAWDYARILRLPFTENRKVNKEGVTIVKKSVLHTNNLEVQDWIVPGLEKVAKNLTMPNGSFPLPDHNQIASECHFFKWLDQKPDEVHEPHAYAMLSITGHFKDDQVTSKRFWEKFSSPSINSKDLGEFTEQALRASGPRTCQGIAEIFDGCKTCPHYQKIVSPILIKGKDFIGTEHCGFTLKGPRGGLLRQYGDLLQSFENEYSHKSVGPIKKIYTFTGTHYKIADQIEIKNYAYTKFEPISKSEERKEFLSLVTDSNYTGKEFLSGENTKGLVNFQNGVLDINTMLLTPHDSNKNFLYCLPYDYDPAATCDYYDEFIRDVTLEREDLGRILNEYLGYIVSGVDYIFQKALILEGSGKNGKSTFINLIRDLVGGENCSNISVNKLEHNNFASSGLHGKLVNFSEEEPPKTFSETNGLFKNLTGDGVVNAEYKFGDAFEFINRAKLIISYNEKPYIKDTSTGMLRRLLIIPFEYDLESNPDKVNPNIKHDLARELPGIFNRALEGYKRLVEQRNFTKSIHVDEMVNQVHRFSDIVKAFVEDEVEITNIKDEFVTFNDLYDAFTLYFEDQNSTGRPISKIALSTRLRKLKLFTNDMQRNGKRFKAYRGISLNNNKEVEKPKF